MTVLRCITGCSCFCDLVAVSVVVEVSEATSHGESWFKLGTEPLEFSLEVSLLAAVPLPACGDSCNTLTVKRECNTSGTLSIEVHCYNKLCECSMVQAIYSDSREKIACFYKIQIFNIKCHSLKHASWKTYP